jgi:hypothetical protein
MKCYVADTHSILYRIIAATARALGVPLVTVDPAVVESGLVTIVW